MSDRVVLVTGGARGIGLGIVEAFANAGFKVMIADLGGVTADSCSSAGSNSSASGDAENWNYNLANKQDLDLAQSKAGQLGEVACCEVDVTNSDSCVSAVAATIERFGQLDVLINNAGVVQSGPLLEFSEDDWDKVFAVNTKGIFLMTRAALPALLESKDAAVVNTASIAGKKGYADMAAYCGSKFAAIGITQSLANEFSPSGIRVNAICPGIVGTAMWLEHLMPSNTTDIDEKNRDFEDAMAERIPMGRPQTVEDMGQAALYLATARNVTGVALSVAGGIEMN